MRRDTALIFVKSRRYHQGSAKPPFLEPITWRRQDSGPADHPLPAEHIAARPWCRIKARLRLVQAAGATRVRKSKILSPVSKAGVTIRVPPSLLLPKPRGLSTQCWQNLGPAAGYPIPGAQGTKVGGGYGIRTRTRPSSRLVPNQVCLPIPPNPRGPG